MDHIVKLSADTAPTLEQIGGKAYSLSLLKHEGFVIPESYCVKTSAYQLFIKRNSLDVRIQMELTRKPLADCRWEELWDISLRIRNLFLRAKMPAEISSELSALYHADLGNCQLAARSSSTVEDSAASSFAGLHESHIGIRTLAELEEKVRLVWASLWSDAALSYRRELNLKVADSRMAVLIQPLLSGKSSGICFSKSPSDESQAVIEAVYGLNQGLVDGKIEPDRWMLKRDDAQIISHAAAKREQKFMATDSGVVLTATSALEASEPPLNSKNINRVFSMAMKAEAHYRKAQDTEWTIIEDSVYLLQSRPITTQQNLDPKTNRRAWDIALKRSFSNLCELREKISDHLKNMEAEGLELLAQSLKQLDNEALVEALEQRQNRLKHWTDIYWDVFIPYGHGMRLFGQIYNETMLPDDPYEFVVLLQVNENLATRRNRELATLAALVQQNDKAMKLIAANSPADLDAEIVSQLRLLVEKYAMPPRLLDLNSSDTHRMKFLKFVAGMPVNDENHEANNNVGQIARLEQAFEQKFAEGEAREHARQLLDLGRHSFLMRDDDNVFLNRFKNAIEACREEISSRIAAKITGDTSAYSDSDLVKKLGDANFTPTATISAEPARESAAYGKGSKRQIVGQPAGPGFGFGIARIVTSHEDIFELKKGEIIVCDAIGPEMTIAVPMAAGIVERRGGMLIHGAIIAREYGIPCVTGITDATSAIKNGDQIAIDGYLGIVTIRRQKAVQAVEVLAGAAELLQQQV